jgi:hypothetical protein
MMKILLTLAGLVLTVVPIAAYQQYRWAASALLAALGQSSTGGVLAPQNQEPLYFTVNNGPIEAPNVIYSLIAGEGISVSDSQNPTITNTGVLSLQGQTGAIELVAGSGITLNGLTLSSAANVFKTLKVSGSSDITASGLTDTLTLAGDGGVTLTTDGKKITITAATPDYTLSGFTDGGTSVYLTTSTDKVGIGTTTPSEALELGLGKKIKLSTDLYNLGQSDLISLQWMENYAKPAIVWFDENGDRQAALTAHYWSQTEQTEHKHFSIETTKSTGTGLYTRLSVGWGQDNARIGISDAYLDLGNNKIYFGPNDEADIYWNDADQTFVLDSAEGYTFGAAGTPTHLIRLNQANGTGDVALLIQNNATTNGETSSLLFTNTTTQGNYAARVQAERVDASNHNLHLANRIGGTVTNQVSLLSTGVVSVNGILAVGVTTPQAGANAEIYGNGADVEFLVHEDAGSNEARIHLRRATRDWEIINTADLTIEVEGTEVVRIDDAGNFGIGTTSPTSKLHISGAVTGKALAIFNETGDQALLTASASGTTKFTVLHNGLVNATAGGLATYTKAGTISDVDFSDTPVDGLFGFDTTNHRLYFREGGAWSFIARDGGFQIPVEETEGLTEGDLLLPYVESKMADGSLHGLYTKFSEVKGLLFHEETEAIANLQAQLAGISAAVMASETEQVESTNPTLLTSLSEAIGELKEQFNQLENQVATLITQVNDLLVRVAKIEQAELVGTATIPAGAKSIKVTFGRTFAEIPNVYITPTAAIVGSYSVTETTDRYFVIALSGKQAGESSFNWFAKVGDSNGGVEILDEGASSAKAGASPSHPPTSPPSTAEGSSPISDVSPSPSVPATAASIPTLEPNPTATDSSETP